MTLPLSETYERLLPRIRALAGMVFADHEVTVAAVTVRFAGVDHELRLERQGRDARLTVRAGATPLYRGRLSSFYGTAERARKAA